MGHASSYTASALAAFVEIAGYQFVMTYRFAFSGDLAVLLLEHLYAQNWH